MDAANIAVRLAQYLTLGALFGLAAFGLYARQAAALLTGRWSLIWLAAACMIASLASILVLAAQMTGGADGAQDPAVLWAVISGTDAGKAWIARLAALAVCLYGVWAARPVLAARASGLALATLAWSGHAAAQEGLFGYIRLAGDILHLLAAGVWLGALAAFAGLVIRKADAGVTARALASFSGVGTGVVAVLILTGLINLAPSVDWRPWPVLTTSLWGQLLLVKLALFAAMLGLAAANRFILTPRLEAGARDGATGGLGHLRLSLALELALAVAVVALVSWLGTLAPPTAG
jgi:putative copper resistance protein D